MRDAKTTATNEPWPRGCVHVYTGDGKGKTTAALGLALRAAGRGYRVFVGQLMKSYPYGEVAGAAALGEAVTLVQLGSTECLAPADPPDPRDVQLARDGLARCRRALVSGDYRIVVLDEACVAVRFGLLDEAELLAAVDARPDDVELVVTGRWATEGLLERADYVTEMREVRHPYAGGLAARDGIER